MISGAIVSSNYSEPVQPSVEEGPVILDPAKLAELAADKSDGQRWIVRDLAYIEWPAEEHRETDRVEFWQKGRDAITE